MTSDQLIKQDVVSTISHVPDFYNRYPGDVVNFHTCIVMGREQTNKKLTVFLPKGIHLLDNRVIGDDVVKNVSVRDLESSVSVEWQLSDDLTAGEPYEFITVGSIQMPERDTFLMSEAVLRDQQGYELCSESVRISVRMQSEYMKYLPELYRSDEIMGRFLMLFESFWKPIEQQIDQAYCYFDPDLTPEKFLPWLASWVGVYWDDSLPERRKRRLLHSAVSLYQGRGTKKALEEFLRIYSDGEVEIIEHPAHNLVLGKHSRLGLKVALGKNNFPHTFSVNMKIRKADFEFQQPTDTAQFEKTYQRKIDTIIEAQKPAHTACKLNLKFVDRKKR
ncbi:MAG: phage tail protein [Anaerolineaceae bacterium]|nr:phage tail protein [Anaerolineaceae bacterium]